MASIRSCPPPGVRAPRRPAPPRPQARPPVQHHVGAPEAGRLVLEARQRPRPYTYFRPGAKTSVRQGAIEGRDFFCSEGDVVAFVKSRRVNGREGRVGAIGEDTRGRAAGDDEHLATHVATRRVYRLTLGGLFDRWHVRSAASESSDIVASLLEGDAIVVPAPPEGAGAPPGAWLPVAAVIRASGDEEILTRAGYSVLHSRDGAKQLWRRARRPSASRRTSRRLVAALRAWGDAKRLPGRAHAPAVAGRRADVDAPPASGLCGFDAPRGRLREEPSSYVHATFANPRARSCWLSCAFQVLWHSRSWHTCFEAAVEAGVLDGPAASWRAEAPGAKKIDALVATWRDYRATLRAHGAADADDDGDEPAAKKARSDDRSPSPSPGGGAVDAVSPEHLAEAFASEADKHGYGDAAEALSAVQAALDHPSMPPAARALADIYRIAPVPFEGDLLDAGDRRAAPPPRTSRRRRRATPAAPASPRPSGRRGAAVIALDLAWPRTLDGASIEALALAFAPDDAEPIKLYACVCYCHRLQHYVAYVRRASDHSKFLFFNDLPGVLAPRARRSKKGDEPAADAPTAAVTWADAAKACGAAHLQPRLVLYEDHTHPSVQRALTAVETAKPK
ncbi:hypothetical protein JL721_9707 [Aureococcus anophagefferens]|nr:hypothetical protein JL721_9707 [Aureococcus anophagefferens]